MSQIDKTLLRFTWYIRYGWHACRSRTTLTFPTHPESASGVQPLPIKSFCAMALKFLLTGFEAIYILNTKNWWTIPKVGRHRVMFYQVLINIEPKLEITLITITKSFIGTWQPKLQSSGGTAPQMLPTIYILFRFSKNFKTLHRVYAITNTIG